MKCAVKIMSWFSMIVNVKRSNLFKQSHFNLLFLFLLTIKIDTASLINRSMLICLFT